MYERARHAQGARTCVKASKDHRSLGGSVLLLSLPRTAALLLSQKQTALPLWQECLLRAARARAASQTLGDAVYHNLDVVLCLLVGVRACLAARVRSPRPLFQRTALWLVGHLCVGLAFFAALRVARTLVCARVRCAAGRARTHLCVGAGLLISLLVWVVSRTACGAARVHFT